MTLEELIYAEFKLYLERYKEWDDSNQVDETAELLAAESERILKQLYSLKFGVKAIDDVLGYMRFMAYLGEKIKL